jgi:hypothetical protein
VGGLLAKPKGWATTIHFCPGKQPGTYRETCMSPPAILSPPAIHRPYRKTCMSPPAPAGKYLELLRADYTQSCYEDRFFWALYRATAVCHASRSRSGIRC